MAERDKDGFLERWSRRKRSETSTGAPVTGAPVTGTPVPGAPVSETPKAGRSGRPPAKAQSAAAVPPKSQDSPDAGDPEAVAKLPDLDTLTEDSDFTAFFQDGVPEVIRRKALRRLWRLNPVFANLDGLNDYDEDFSTIGIVAENIKTAYKVGKGYLDEADDETEAEAEVEIAADEFGDDDAGAAEGRAEAESSIPGDPSDATKDSLSRPESGSAPVADSNRTPQSVNPGSGSALARRWGGKPDKG